MSFAAGVYDQSHRRADTNSYWQWKRGWVGKDWDLPAECVSRGWPTSMDFSKPAGRWYGYLPANGDGFWIYRIYAAGKDRFGREGRFFFVMILLNLAEQVLIPEVAGLFHYFETERGLPLKTDPLDEGLEGAAPDEILKSVDKELRKGRTVGHWGIDDGLQIRLFQNLSCLPPLIEQKGRSPRQAQRHPKRPNGYGTPLAIGKVFRFSHVQLRYLVRYWKEITGFCTIFSIILLFRLLVVSPWCNPSMCKQGKLVQPPPSIPIKPDHEEHPSKAGNGKSRGTPGNSTGDAQMGPEEIHQTDRSKIPNNPQINP